MTVGTAGKNCRPVRIILNCISEAQATFSKMEKIPVRMFISYIVSLFLSECLLYRKSGDCQRRAGETRQSG